MANSGTLNSIKHFPGHGDTATDSHLGLPVIDKSMDELMGNELYPFQKLIESGVDSVMVGHLLLPHLDSENPSTTSSKIISGLLRKQLGFNGVIISDALNMHAVSKMFPQKESWKKLPLPLVWMCFVLVNMWKKELPKFWQMPQKSGFKKVLTGCGH